MKEAGKEAAYKGYVLKQQPKRSWILPCGQTGKHRAPTRPCTRGAQAWGRLHQSVSGLQMLKNAWRGWGGGWEGEALRTEAHALVDGRYLGHVKKAESNAVFLN